MITNLEIENFKGISNLKINDLKQFNIFIGKNDASKSTVLESIYAFHASLVNPVENFSTILRKRFGDQHARELWHNYSTSVKPAIKIKAHDTDCKITFQTNFDFQSVDIITDIGDKGQISYKMTALLNKITNQSNQDLLTRLEGHLREFFENMLFFDEMYRLQIRKWEGTIMSKQLSGIDVYDTSNNGLSSAEYTGNNIRLMIGQGTSAKFLDGFGEGHKSGLALLTIVNFLKNTVLLIEEIETHQHPEALRSLIQKIIEICTANNNQVFVTTHSPEVLQLFSTSPNTKLIHLSKETDSSLVLSDIAPNNIQMIRDLGWNVGKILSYEKFVLVEGELDKAVFEHSFHKLKGYWPEEVGITIIITYGIGKLKQILKSIAIPEKSIFIQRDLDNNDQQTIVQNIVDGFCELTREGYTRSDDGDKIKLTKDSVVKQLDKSKIFTTGLPSHFSQITKHATDDYLLYMIEQNPALLTTINANRNSISTLQEESSKNILSATCGNYDSLRAIEILANADIGIFPSELKDIIDKIETS